MRETLQGSALTLGVALLMVKLLVSSRFRELAVDRPNERSLHNAPVPRTGGLAILVGTTSGAWLLYTRGVLIVWGLALTLGFVSFLDDRRGLPISIRFATQIGAAVALVLSILPGLGGWSVLAVVSIVWMTNLYNFMDGADGMAGGMGTAGFFAYSLAALQRGEQALALFCACLVAGCLAFLSKNSPPAKIFMGDTGSTVLGFCAAAIGVYGLSLRVWPLWFPALVFLPFIADATVTITRRALRGEKVWQPHRQHYYQRLVLSGWSHRRLAWVAWMVMAGTSASAVAARNYAPAVGWAVLAGWSTIFVVFMLAIDLRWSRFTRQAES